MRFCVSDEGWFRVNWTWFQGSLWWVAVEEAVWAELLVRYGRWLGACGRWRQVFFWVMSCNGFGLSWVRERERLVVLSGRCFSGRLDRLPWWSYGRGIQSLLGGWQGFGYGWFMVLIRKMRESLCMMVVGSFLLLGIVADL